MVATIIGSIIVGGIIGALARAVLPGKQSLSIPKTIGLGIIANLLVGLVLSGAGTVASIIVGAAVAVGILWLADRQGWVKTT